MTDPIVRYPDPGLTMASRVVRKPDATTALVFAAMWVAMKDAKGIGIAAPQLGISQRLCICRVGGSDVFMVNPKITAAFGVQTKDEGCLSIPGLRGAVSRASMVIVEWTDTKGRKLKKRYQGDAARVVQHEVDHLNGVLWINHVLPNDQLEKELGALCTASTQTAIETPSSK